MRLIIDPSPDYHVSLDVASEFESAILGYEPFRASAIRSTRFLSRSSYLLWRSVESLRHRMAAERGPMKAGSPDADGDSDYFAVLMGVNFRKCFPAFMRSGRKSLYLFDAWPYHHEAIRQFMRSGRTDYLFVSSSQAAASLRQKDCRTIVDWVPEGVDIEQYAGRAYADKDISILALGRRYDAYHDQIAGPCEADGITYLYERARGAIVFPTREGFLDGLGRTKISICFPRSITHPDQAGGIETMTIRYLQSMASKCLVLGHAPKEMVELFGYDPVVEIDADHPMEQIRSILRKYGDYQPLIERNYETVRQHHTWRDRCRQIAGILGIHEGGTA